MKKLIILIILLVSIPLSIAMSSITWTHDVYTDCGPSHPDAYSRNAGLNVCGVPGYYPQTETGKPFAKDPAYEDLYSIAPFVKESPYADENSFIVSHYLLNYLVIAGVLSGLCILYGIVRAVISKKRAARQLLTSR